MLHSSLQQQPLLFFELPSFLLPPPPQHLSNSGEKKSCFVITTLSRSSCHRWRHSLQANPTFSCFFQKFICRCPRSAKPIAVGEHQTLKTLLPRTKPFFFSSSSLREHGTTVHPFIRSSGVRTSRPRKERCNRVLTRCFRVAILEQNCRRHRAIERETERARERKIERHKRETEGRT